jgi:hypothetical protein
MGSGDCERMREGWLAQPFNAVTSLAFVVVGATTMKRARKRPWEAGRIALAAAAAATGVGSFLFHGPQPRGAHRLHDGSMTWLVVQVLLFRDSRLLERRTAYSAAATTVVGALAIRARRENAVVGAAAAAIAVKELRALRGRREIGELSGPYGRALAALIASAAALALGRTGSPLCNPDRFLQLHGLWHVGAAIALDGYVTAMDAPATASC